MFAQLKKISSSKNVIIYSDLFTILGEEKTRKEILNYILKVVNLLLKKKYTIILPSFNLNFPKTKVTGYSADFITTGYLNKFLISKMNFYRTAKPIYNYAVLGPNTQKILNLKQTTAWGEDSVLGYLVRNNAAGLGFNINPNDFGWVVIHCCEEDMKVPYRFYKKFSGKNIDLNKSVFEKMYVRNLAVAREPDYTKIINLLSSKDIVVKKNKNFLVTTINLLNYYKIGISSLKKNTYFLFKK